MRRNTWITLVLFLVVNILLTIFNPTKLWVYIFPSICWLIFTFILLYFIVDLNNIKKWINVRLTLMGLLTAMFYIL